MSALTLRSVPLQQCGGKPHGLPLLSQFGQVRIEFLRPWAAGSTDRRFVRFQGLTMPLAKSVKLRQLPAQDFFGIDRRCEARRRPWAAGSTNRRLFRVQGLTMPLAKSVKLRQLPPQDFFEIDQRGEARRSPRGGGG